MRPLHTRHRTAIAAAACWFTLVAAPAALASGSSFTGTFTDDDELVSLTFSLASADTLVARSFSFAGGVNAAGQAIAGGGFAPVLSLFDTDGLLLQTVSGSASVCGAGVGGVDAASGFCWDAGLSATLAAGHYTLVLSQDGNPPLGPFLADGYAMTGSPDYTGLAYLGTPGLRFINADGGQRNGHWALDTSVAAIVPEPAAWALLAGGLLALGAAARQRRPARC